MPNNKYRTSTYNDADDDDEEDDGGDNAEYSADTTTGAENSGKSKTASPQTNTTESKQKSTTGTGYNSSPKKYSSNSYSNGTSQKPSAGNDNASKGYYSNTKRYSDPKSHSSRDYPLASGGYRQSSQSYRMKSSRPRHSHRSSRRRSSRRSKRKRDPSDEKCQSNSVISFICKLLKHKDCGCQAGSNKALGIKFDDPCIPPPFRKKPQLFLVNDPCRCCCCPRQPCCCCCDGCGCAGPSPCCRCYCRCPCPCMSPCCSARPCCCPCPCYCPSPIVAVKTSVPCCDDCCVIKSLPPSYNNCNFYMTPKEQGGNDRNCNGWYKEDNGGPPPSKRANTSTGRPVNYEYRSRSTSISSSATASETSYSGCILDARLLCSRMIKNHRCRPSASCTRGIRKTVPQCFQTATTDYPH